MLFAEGKELGFGADAPDGMEELRADAFADEVRIFFDLLRPLGIGNGGIADCLLEFADVGQHLAASWLGDGTAGKMIADL